MDLLAGPSARVWPPQPSPGRRPSDQGSAALLIQRLSKPSQGSALSVGASQAFDL
jgi:hypothetical protein